MFTVRYLLPTWMFFFSREVYYRTDSFWPWSQTYRHEPMLRSICFVNYVNLVYVAKLSKSWNFYPVRSVLTRFWNCWGILIAADTASAMLSACRNFKIITDEGWQPSARLLYVFVVNLTVCKLHLYLHILIYRKVHISVYFLQESS